MQVHLDEAIQNYTAWLKDIKKAPYHTLRAYQVDLIQFLKYFLILEINHFPGKNEMDEYLSNIKNKFNYASYRRKVTVLRNFTKYLIDCGINVPDSFISISLPLPEVDFNMPANFEDVILLLEKIIEDSEAETRDKLIFSLILKSGLTVKQLLSLKVQDINLAANQIILSRNQMTFIDETTSKLIEKYFSKLQQRAPLALDDYLFANHAKSSKIPLSPRSINFIIDNIRRDYRFDSRLSPTILRRLFGKNLKDKNVNKAVKELILGKKCRLAG